MCHLNEVVEFHSLSDDGAAHGGSVDTGVGTNLHVVLNDDDTYLRNLVIALGIGCEAEAVGTDDTSGVYGHVIANLASLIDGDVGVEETAFAHLHPVADDGMGIDLASLAHHGTFTYNSKGTDIHIIGHLCRGSNAGHGVDAFFLGFGRLIEL